MCLKGKLGYKGERGFSTYELAVQHGFEGTEEEWLQTLGIEQVYQYVDTKKAEIEATCVHKDNFAIITGFISTPTLSNFIDYPTGFTRENCVVISSMERDDAETPEDTTTWNTFVTTNINDVTQPYLVVRLGKTKISLPNLACYLPSPKQSFHYRIVLMKIS